MARPGPFVNRKKDHRPVHAVVKILWEAIPKPLRDVVASAVDRAQGIEIPAPPTLPPDTPIRLFIGPVNYAGQGDKWARAAEQNPLVLGRNLVSSENNVFRYDADYTVRWRTMTHSRRWQRDFLKALTDGYTHVLFEAQFPVLGGMFNHDVRRQIRALRDGGVKVGMVCHGTDIRLPSAHRAREPWSYFADSSWTSIPRLEKLVTENRQLLDDVGAPTFVSTAGLLLDVPYAQLLPVVIDPALWQTSEPVLKRERIRVMHVPSHPLQKGSILIDDAMQRLQDEGIIEYTHVLGQTQTEMPALVASSDIVLDQFRVGEYGVAACEAMAAGRLVVSHVSDQVRGVVADKSGMQLPIVEGTIDSLEGVLRDIATHRDHYASIAAQGPEFVRTLHDGRFSRIVLEQHFLLN